MPEELKPTMTQNFIHDFIDEDIAQGGQFQGMTVHTRFPPEPNGYLHIGHAKAIFVDFGTAEKYGGLCNLRMDDTNPTKEDVEYVEAIQEDIHWLGYDWGDRFFFASDYFEKMYEYAVELIKKGLAYVCELTPEQFKEVPRRREHSRPLPFRDRPIEESLDLFARMRAGEFPNGAMTLRAKIDLASGNFNMRDPVLYRINHMHHHRQGTSGASTPCTTSPTPGGRAGGITHSLCSLEFEDHRPLYDWVIANCPVPARPRQIEFARLGINYTVMSKRKLRQLVEEGRVSGWDDPACPPSAACAGGATPPGHPQLLRAQRREQGSLHRGVRLPGALPAGGFERDRPAAHGGAPPGTPHHHQLPRGAERDLLRGEQPQPPGGRRAGGRLLPGAVYRGGGLSPRAGAQVQAPLPRRAGVPPQGPM